MPRRRQSRWQTGSSRANSGHRRARINVLLSGHPQPVLTRASIKRQDLVYLRDVWRRWIRALLQRSARSWGYVAGRDSVLEAALRAADLPE
jgi:hypothetical protein